MRPEQMRDALQALGMNQAQLAAYLRVTEGAVSRWLSGGRPIPGPICKLIEMALSQEGIK